MPVKGGSGVYWILSGDDKGDFPRSPGGLHYPEDVLPPLIGEATQPLMGGSGKGLRGLRYTISVVGPLPLQGGQSSPTSTHYKFTMDS